MKKYRIDTSIGNAETDIEKIFEYIARDSPKNALDWYLGLKNGIQTLVTMPQRCPKAPENELADYTIYHLIIGNYRILYRIENDVVQILHVRGKGQEYKL